MATLFEPTLAAPENSAPSALPGWLDTLRQTQSGFSAGLPFGRGTVPANTPHDAMPSEQDPITIARAEAEAAGYAAAKAEFDAQLAQIKTGFTQIDNDCDQQLAAMLCETVTALCESTLAPLALDQDALANRCRAAATALHQEWSGMSLSVHPDDFAHVEAALDGSLALHADPDLPRGSFRLTSPDSVVLDGPDQWSAAIRRAIEQC